MAVGFQTVGAGQSSSSVVGSFSFNSGSGTAGDYALLVVQLSGGTGSLSNVYYGGSGNPMTQLGSAYGNQGSLLLYELYNIPGGVQTVTGTISASRGLAVNVFTYSGVTGSSVQANSGSTSVLGSNASIPSQTCPASGLIVGCLGMGTTTAVTPSSPTGGTNRYLGVPGGTVALAVSDNNATTTFAWTQGFAYTEYAAVALTGTGGGGGGTSPTKFFALLG